VDPNGKRICIFLPLLATVHSLSLFLPIKKKEKKKERRANGTRKEKKTQTPRREKTKQEKTKKYENKQSQSNLLIFGSESSPA